MVSNDIVMGKKGKSENDRYAKVKGNRGTNTARSPSLNEEVGCNITNLSKTIFFLFFESLMATSMGSGDGSIKIGRASFSTISGRMRTR